MAVDRTECYANPPDIKKKLGSEYIAVILSSRKQLAFQPPTSIFEKSWKIFLLLRRILEFVVEDEL